MDWIYMELGEYFATPQALEVEAGKWQASVVFERRADHAAQKELIPSVRHVIKGFFLDNDTALQAAADYGHELHRERKIGL